MIVLAKGICFMAEGPLWKKINNWKMLLKVLFSIFQSWKCFEISSSHSNYLLSVGKFFIGCQDSHEAQQWLKCLLELKNLPKQHMFCCQSSAINKTLLLHLRIDTVRIKTSQNRGCAYLRKMEFACPRATTNLCFPGLNTHSIFPVSFL